MEKKPSSIWSQAIGTGLIAGAVGVLVSLVGMVEAFSKTFIITGLVTLADILLLAPVILLAYTIIRKATLMTKRSLLGYLLLCHSNPLAPQFALSKTAYRHPYASHPG